MTKSLTLSIALLWGYMATAQGSTGISLSGQWRLSFGPFDRNSPASPAELEKMNWPTIPASVPGNVELDLLASGKIRNPETGNNVYQLRPYEAYQWWYQKTFQTPGHEAGSGVELVFEGLDCICSIWLNNTLIGKTDNMLIEHRFDVTGLLNSRGTNTLFVRIDPAVAVAQKYTTSTLGTRNDFSPEGMHLRKAPHMFGWDIMPRLVSAGIWRDVRLDIRKPTRLRQVYWMTNTVDVRERKAELLVDWEVATDRPIVEGMTMELTLSRLARTVWSDTFPVLCYAGRQRISLEDVALWWPRGYGDPALYDAVVRIRDTGGSLLDECRQRVGIRTAELVHSNVATDDHPGEFLFRINGEKIFVRGTNWVPMDALHSRDHLHLSDVFRMVTDLNCNMIRCWGGSVYEDHPFFDLCDENGVMVWQDFALGCTEYPQDSDFIGRIRNEAVATVTKLRMHPSLVLWSGNNENDASLDWTFNRRIDPGLDMISREVLPRVIWEFDPVRSYLPSSPYYSEEYFRSAGDQNTLPEVHLWGPRGYYKAPFYTGVRAHFVSEIGYHGCPNRRSLERMFDPEFVYPWTADGKWNDEWQTKAVRAHSHSHATDGRIDLLTKQVQILFGDVPRDLDTFIFASQAVQAEALKSFIEFWRMDKFRRTGIIWWNLRDGWPILSDAVVDYYNSKKLAYYYIRSVQHDACVMIGDARDGAHPVIAVNDTRKRLSGSVVIRDADTGENLLSETFTIPENGSVLVGGIAERKGQSMWLVDYTIDSTKSSNHYLHGDPPFHLSDYQRWYSALGMEKDRQTGN
ncbi:MAG TPA: glycoside hydrolase family 2 [Bacteroidota bacterium]|nr:glycoside hydrolase family 2 [Bacteroidota bacterium]